MSDAIPPSTVLQTWKEIAKYLGVSVRTAQNRERDAELPVHHGSGEKGQVWALTAEIDAWRISRNSRGAGTVDVLDDAPSAQRSSTPLTRRLWLAGLAVAGGGVLLAVARRAQRSMGAEVAMMAVDGRALVARDAAGREIWRHLFAAGLHRSYYQPGTLAGAYWIGDLDGDGHAEVLFTYDSSAGDAENSTLYCFDRSGRVRWTFRPGRLVRDAGGDILPLYHVRHVLVSTGKAGARIAVSSVHPTDQACQLAFLTASGTLAAEYWHPGHLYFLAESRSAPDGPPRVLAGGVNNGEHRATLVVLDPFAMSGASTPSVRRDPRFQLLGMPESREEVAILFARSCLGRNELYTRVSELEADAQAVRVKVMESVEDSDRVVYYEFSPGFALSRVFASNQYREEHQKLERSGQLTHSVDTDIKQLERDLEIRRILG